MKVTFYFCEVIANQNDKSVATSSAGVRLHRILSDTDPDYIFQYAKIFMNDHRVVFYNKKQEI